MVEEARHFNGIRGSNNRSMSRGYDELFFFSVQLYRPLVIGSSVLNGKDFIRKCYFYDKYILNSCDEYYEYYT